MPSLQNLATDDAIHRILVFWTRPFLADDRTFFNEGVNAPCGIHEFAFHNAGKVIFYVSNNSNFHLHGNRIIGAFDSEGPMIGEKSPLHSKPTTSPNLCIPPDRRVLA